MTQSEKKSLIPLRILVVEDSEDDTMLVLRELTKGGYQPEFARVENGEALRRELAQRQWDLVISDYSMPDFDGVSALKIVREFGLDIPFILVSGTITEETAVKSLKSGAQDFITKFNLARLIPAVERELKEAEVRRERRRIQEELEAYHAGLEKKVEERTRELQSANDRLRKSKELSDSFNRIGDLIHSTLDMDKIMQRVVFEAARATGADASSIGLLHDGSFVMRYVFNLPQEFVDVTLPLDKVRGVGYALKSRDAVAFNDAQSDERVNRSFWKEHGVKSLMAVPLLSRNEIIGAFTFYSIRTRIEFGEVHLDFARKLSTRVSLALENARLYRETREAQERASFFAGALEDSSQPFAAGYPDGRIMNFNKAFSDLTGYDPEELRAMAWMELTPQEWHEHEAQQLRELDRTGIPRLYQKEYIRKDRSRVPIEIKVHLARGECGKPLYYYAFVADITNRKKAEEALRESEERFREAFAHAPIGMMLADARGRYQYSNRAFMDIMGYSVQDMHAPEFDIRKVSHHDDLPFTIEGIKKLLAGEIPAFFQEKRYIRKDGSVIWVALSASVRRSADGTPFQIVGLFENINDRKRMEEEIRHMAHHDSLTGLPNRRLFADILRVELAQGRRHKSKLAVLFLDLDRFKDINDTLGHEVGDELLKEVARRFRKTIREADTVARIGGDEFNIVIGGIFRTEDIGDFAQKIINSLRKPLMINGNELNITTSIGISVYPDDSEDIEVLRKYADIAMYHAKQSGRNMYQFYNHSINVRSIEHMRLESMLRRSIDADELVIYYQPQINIRSKQIICAEALVRWRHPKHGFLIPGRFLPLAEETGFITEIDDWALKTACRQVRSWVDSGLPPVCVTVNLSSRRFQSPDLVREISSVLAETRVPPGCLDIEVTESLVMSDVDRTASQLKSLQEMGVHISIDDFGTGYSSLNYLKRLPIERLKIDKSFIQDIAADPDDRAIIHAVTAMAHSMKLKVVAEGVETEEQLEFLSKAGCDEMQGFLFSEPLPAEKFRELVSKQ